MPKNDDKVFNILKKNQGMLIEFIEKFQNDRGNNNNNLDLFIEDEDFFTLKDQMIKVLRELE